VEAARDQGTLTMRRGFVLGFKSHGVSKRAARPFRQLKRAEPDLAPTLAFATG
jgi:hypothetical protein